MKDYLLLPEIIIDKLIEEFGPLDGHKWFSSVGHEIVTFYDTHSSLFKDTYLSPKTGYSVDALKKAMGFDTDDRTFRSTEAGGANKFIRGVLTRRYSNKQLGWDDYLIENKIDPLSLVPNPKRKEEKERRLSLKAQAKDPNHACAHLHGYWLSRFEYISKGQDAGDDKYQIDIECLQISGKNTLSGLNTAIISPSGREYQHNLTLEIYHSFLIGRWINSNSNNSGVFQLHINNNKCVMEGLHLGNANDNSVQCGKWIWIKISDEVSEEHDELIRVRRLNKPELLSEQIKKWKKKFSGITLADVLISI